MNTLKQLTKRFFQYEARLVLKKYKPKIITIIGSVGKTTTKDALYPILSKKFFVRKSEKSFTTELGVPLTIIGCPYGSGSVLEWTRNVFIGLKLIAFKSHYPDFLILEVDGDKPGDLLGLSTWLFPDILVITAIGEVPSHIEAFDSDIEKFLVEKKNIIDSVARTGTIIYNADDEIVGRLVEKAPVRAISCGKTPDCDIRMSDFTVLYGTTKNGSIPTGMSYEIFAGKESYPVTVFSTLGLPMQYASLLAVSVANILGVSIGEGTYFITKLSFLPGRMHIVAGIKDTTIIDDSYNSSPIAMMQALDTFSHIDATGRKIAVIGDMFELGKFASDEHRKLAEMIKSVASYVVCVGIRSHRISEELLSLGFDESSLVSFDTSDEAGKFLQNIIEIGDVILVKGSQAMRMERVVEEIMRHPEDKATLLVRQEPEWLERE